MQHLTTEHWQRFQKEGYIILRRLLDKETVESLQSRIDEIMLGKAGVDYGRMLMQLDSETGNYGDMGEQTKGFKGNTLAYRKIQDLEFDPVFLDLMRHPLFEDACRRVYGDGTDVACFRAMFMNKPSNRGTVLPWHQDRWDYLDRDPQLTVWVALDPATRENGCVKIIPGSHLGGLINPNHHSGFLTEDQASEFAPSEQVKYLELEPGDVALLHNQVLHSSDRNHSAQSRRAFSICYMDAQTRDLRKHAAEYSVIFGRGALQLA